jgi:hypothetical protein
MSLSVREDSLRLEGLNIVSLAAFPDSPGLRYIVG